MMFRVFSLMASLLLLAASAGAQEGLRIAAVVNDDILSARDLEIRVRMIMSATRIDDSPENRRRMRADVLRALIDERLQIQEAKRLGIAVTEDELQRARSNIARQNNVPVERFDEFLARTGIDKEGLNARLTAELSWSKVINQRLRPLTRVSDEEIDAALVRLESSRGQIETLMSEILIPVDRAENDAEIGRSAARLAGQIAGGSSFADIARQFSAGATAGSGGDIGWVLPGQLPEELDEALSKLPVGRVSEPIRSFGGYYLLLARDRRKALTPDPMRARLLIAQLLVAVSAETPADAALARLRALIPKIKSCLDLANVATAERLSGSGELGSFLLADMAEGLRNQVAQLETGQSTQPERIAEGWRVITVCNRTEDRATAVPTRDAVADTLVQRRLSLQALRYLRNLRRDAFIEFR